MMYDCYHYGLTVADRALNMNDCKREIQTKHFHPYKVKTEEHGDLGIRSMFILLYGVIEPFWNNEKETT